MMAIDVLRIAGIGLGILIAVSGVWFLFLRLWSLAALRKHLRRGDRDLRGRADRSWLLVLIIAAGGALAVLSAMLRTPVVFSTPAAPPTKLILFNVNNSGNSNTTAPVNGDSFIVSQNTFSEAESCRGKTADAEDRFKDDIAKGVAAIENVARDSTEVLVLVIGSHDHRRLRTSTGPHRENATLARQRALCFREWLEPKLAKDTDNRTTFIELERAGNDQAFTPDELKRDRAVTVIALAIGSRK